MGMVSYGADDGRIYVRDTGAPVVRNIYGATAPVSTARIISSLTVSLPLPASTNGDISADSKYLLLLVWL